MGLDAERVVKKARSAVAGLIGAAPEKIVFTGGGTESDNLALGSAFKNPARAAEGLLFVSPVEHPAVRKPAAWLASLGTKLVVLPADACGAVDAAAAGRALEEALGCGATGRILLSVMHVNNELGTIQPVAGIARLKARIRERTGAEIVLHTDAVQSYGKLPIDLSSAEGPGGFAGVDLLTCSAHKAHGPKGVGALYAAEPKRLAPLVRGGGQERGLRSGTENVPGIAGFGAAASERADADGGLRAAAERTARLRARLLGGIMDRIPDVRLNSPAEVSVSGEPGRCSPYLLNVSFLGTRGEVILHDLERRGVFVSTGSACSNIAKKKVNPVLAAIGLSPREAEGALRFSLSPYTTEDEIDYALEQVEDAVARYRRGAL
jgi:cysteine desulfurase